MANKKNGKTRSNVKTTALVSILIRSLRTDGIASVEWNNINIEQTSEAIYRIFVT